MARRARRRLAAHATSSCPVLFHKSRYAERLPIGKPDIIKSAPPERIRAFYDGWYRPERMAIIAVGDIDPEQLEALIRRSSGALPKPRGAARPRGRTTCRCTPNARERRDRSGSARDRRCRSSGSASARADDTVGDYRGTLVEQLVSRMFNERFCGDGAQAGRGISRRRRRRRRLEPRRPRCSR